MNTCKKIISVLLSIVLIAAFVPSFAFAAGQPDKGATYYFSEDTESTSNAEEGWEWNKDTLTLILNNASIMKKGEENCSVEFKEPVDPEAYYTVEFSGTSTLQFSIKGVYDTNIRFKGAEDGVLNIIGTGLYSIYSGSILFESGTVNAKSTVWGTNSIVINGGTLNIDYSKSSDAAARGLLTHTDGKITINGGKFNFYGNFTGNNEPAAIMAQNESREGSALQAIEITGGDIVIKDCAVGIGVFFRSILVDNAKTGSITFDNVFYPFFDNCGADAGEIYIKSANFISDTLTVKDFRENIYRTSANVTVKIGKADYSEVEAALESIPNELTGVSLGNIMALIEAKNAVNYNCDCFEQAKVDEMAEKLESIVQKILDEVPEEPEEPSDPADPPAEDPGDEEVSWFVKLIRAIAGFFKTVFNFIFGWIGK